MRRQDGTDSTNRTEPRCEVPPLQSRFAFNGLITVFRLGEIGRISTAC